MSRARFPFHSLPLALALLASTSCKKEDASNEPEAGANLLGPSVAAADTDDEIGAGAEWSSSDDEDDLGLGEDAEGGMGEEAAEASDLPKLPPKAKPVKKCRGRGKKRTCKMVDPKPKVSAAYGVRTMMGPFRWGMSPQQVLKVLARDIEAEYEKRQKKAKSPLEQDRNRAWREEQLKALKAHHVKFVSAARHRWGVSLIQYEYEDDADEEMIWVRANPTLKKFYFFKDGELWKIFYAYSLDTWPGKSFAEIVEEKFKKWFGPSPKEKVKTDPETGNIVLRYLEWESLGGEKVRAFDMSDVHGVIALVLVDGKTEARIGERLPNTGKKEELDESLEDVVGGSDVCYDRDGNIVECAKDDSE